MSTNKRHFLIATAVSFALGMAGIAQAADATEAPTGQLHAKRLGAIFSDAVPDATVPTLFTALLNIGANPPLDKGGIGYWPCFTGGSDTDCSSIPSGGIVVGEPLPAAVVPHGCKGCAQIYWIVESTSAAKSGLVKVA